MTASFGKRGDGSMWLSIGDPWTGPHVQADWDFGEEYLKLFVKLLHELPATPLGVRE